MGLQISQIFPQTLCSQVTVLIIHCHRFQVSYARTQLNLQRTRDHFPVMLRGLRANERELKQR